MLEYIFEAGSWERLVNSYWGTEGGSGVAESLKNFHNHAIKLQENHFLNIKISLILDGIGYLGGASTPLPQLWCAF